MNLIELYDSLSFPENGHEKTFNAIPIPEFTNYRIAINIDGNPVLFLPVGREEKCMALKNFRLKYLQLEQNVACKISENGKSITQPFTLISFSNLDRTLQEYFLRISETLIKTLGNNPTQQQIIQSLNKFVEVFRSLTDVPTNTVQGLWGELFLIDNSINPKILLDYWHNRPEERFDFNSGEEKIEVKSNSNFERIHTFSSEQLNPPKSTQVLIASIFVRQYNGGQSIQQLVDSIITKVKDNTYLIDKLNTVVCKTLGSSFEESIRIKFDYNIAKKSLQFYSHQDVIKIEELHISNEISEVRYKSDLSSIPPCKISNLQNTKILFQTL